MKKLLFYISALNIGGAETLIFNIVNKIDTSEFEMGFVLQSRINTNERLLELCEQKSCKFFYIVPFYKNYIKSIKQLYDIIKKEGYSLIHIHANALINITPIIAARLANIDIALHSHNTRNNMGGNLGKIIHYFHRSVISNINMIRLACGEDAGRWMFGRNRFEIINNAIDIERYKFCKDESLKLRKEIGIRDSFVVGHISRFVVAKNHDYLVEIFVELLKLKPDAVLLLVGDGELRSKIENKVSELNIKDRVVFLGMVTNPERYYSVFDCMVFPSIFEGLPFTLVEAQASGLKVFASTNVTEEVNVTGLVDYISLEKEPLYWARYIVENYQKVDREMYFEKMQGTVYDVNNEIKRIEKAYNSVR